MKKYFLLIMLLCVIPQFSNGQSETHNWKPLIINDTQKLWYDRSQLDTINNPNFDIWILEMHRPVISLEGIADNIMRTKTLYTVDLQAYKYGLKTVVYYNPSNQVIKVFKYETNSLTEGYKYIFPITENSFMQTLVDELLRLRKLKEAVK